MDNPAQSESTPPRNPDFDLQYYLKELEFQVEIEAKARDRVENMVQYLLTSFAAIIGAVLLVNEMQVNILLVLCIALFLVFGISTSAFYRMCRLRYIITYARVIRNTIRGLLKDMGVGEANRLIDLEGNPSGFCKRMVANLLSFLVLCSLLGGATGMLGLLLLFRQTGALANSPNTQQAILIVAPIALAVLTGGVLWTILRNLKRQSDQLITDPHWKQLPDREL